MYYYLLVDQGICDIEGADKGWPTSNKSLAGVYSKNHSFYYYFNMKSCKVMTWKKTEFLKNKNWNSPKPEKGQKWQTNQLSELHCYSYW